MDNAREEWERAYSYGVKERMSLTEYRDFVLDIGESIVCSAIMEAHPKYNPDWNKQEAAYDKELNGKGPIEVVDDEGLLELLQRQEEPILVVNASELEPLPEEDEGLSY